MDRKQLRYGCLTAVALGSSAALCGCLLLKNLFRFLSFDPTFSAIFQQISHAHIQPPAVFLTLAALGSAYLLLRLQRRKALQIALGILIWLLMTLAAVLLTRVNDIRFMDVLFSLLDALQKGGL